jgi:hypothetical protein
MPMNVFSNQLRAALVARYPCVEIVTWEEARALGLLRSLAHTLHLAFDVWRPEEHDAPLQTLVPWLEALASRPGTVAAVVDAHPWMHDPRLARTIRALTTTLSDHATTIVFVGASPVQFDGLDRDWFRIEMPLPDRDDLLGVIEAVAEEADHALSDGARIASAALGLTSRETERAVRRALALADGSSTTLRNDGIEQIVIDEKRRLLRDAGALDFHAARGTMEQIGGLDELKRWLVERRSAFLPEARAWGLPPIKGLMLLGVQGCGKSLAARCVAGTWGLPLMRLELGAVFGGTIAPDDALRRAMRTAELLAPCVLWVDEIEKSFGGEGDTSTTRLLGTLLTWLQEKTAPVFFVATANRVEGLPPELLRRGRLDEVFFVDLPDAEARRQILAIHLGLHGRDPGGFDLAEIVASCDHFSGAEIEQVVVAALYRAWARRAELSQSDLLTSARQLVPLYTLYEAEIKALRHWAQGRARPAGRDRRLVDLFQRTPE